MASMKIEISEDRELILSDVFSGIGIKTDQGRFGIAQRDGGIEIVKDGKIVWSSTNGPFFVADPRIKATSLRPPPDRVVVEETPEDEDSVESFQERMQHMWGIKIAGRTTVCSKCGAAWTEKNMDYTCDVAVGERALTQLGGCLLAAEGQATGTPGGTPGATKGDYGWSPAFQAVRDLWDEGNRLRMSLEHCRQATMANFDADSLPATGEEGVELYAFTAIRELRNRYDAECAANADKVQTIYRQCQERQAIRTAAVAGDMDRLRDILFPPESDEPESVEETEIKTVVLDAGPDHLKIVEIENVTALRAERDDLKVCLATCEHTAMGNSAVPLGTGAAAIEAVQVLRGDRDQIHAAATGLRARVIRHVDCICSAQGTVNPECPRIEIHRVFDHFEKQVGVAEAKGAERAPDVTPPAKRFDPERLKDKLVIRFDGPPGHESGRFVEVEVNGQSVRTAGWFRDGEYWLLVIGPEDIPQEKRRGDLASRRCEHIQALIVERDRLRQLYDKARIEVLAKTMCTCPQGGVRWEKAHEPTCRMGVALTEFPESP